MATVVVSQPTFMTTLYGQPEVFPYAYRTALKLGTAQIICGILIISFYLLPILAISYNFEIGIGIWNGILFILAGSTGVISSRKYPRTSNNYIITFLVLSIIAGVCAAIFAIICVLAFVGISLIYYHTSEDYEDSQKDSKYNPNLLLAVKICFFIICLIEIIIAIFSSIICCQAVCAFCNPKSSPRSGYSVSGHNPNQQLPPNAYATMPPPSNIPYSSYPMNAQNQNAPTTPVALIKAM